MDFTELSNAIFDVKEKLTDGEFKTIMDIMSDKRKTTGNIYQIYYVECDLNSGDESDDETHQISIDLNFKKRYVNLNAETVESIKKQLLKKNHYNAGRHHLNKWLSNMTDNKDSYCSCCDNDIINKIVVNNTRVIIVALLDC